MTDFEAEDPAVRLAAVARVRTRGRASADELAALVARLGDARKPVQRAAAETLAELAGDEDAVRSLLHGALASASMRQRWGATYALGRLGPPPDECLPVLLEILAQEDGDLRWAAAEILLRMHGRPGLADGLAALLRGPSAAGRKMALYCLRDLGAASVATETAVSSALVDVDVAVRLAAVSAIAALATEPTLAAAAIAPLLEDPDPGVRRATAATLGRLLPHAPEVRAALERAAADDDPLLRRTATRALGRPPG